MREIAKRVIPPPSLQMLVVRGWWLLLLSLNNHGILLRGCKLQSRRKVTNIFGSSKNILGQNHLNHLVKANSRGINSKLQSKNE